MKKSYFLHHLLTKYNKYGNISTYSFVVIIVKCVLQKLYFFKLTGRNRQSEKKKTNNPTPDAFTYRRWIVFIISLFHSVMPEATALYATVT